MDRSFLWIEVLLFVGISQAVFSAILIQAKKNKSVADSILTAWLFLFAIEFSTLIVDIELMGKPLLSSSFLLVNPAFYFYVRALTQGNFRLKPVYLLHLLPFVFFELSAYVVQETITMTDFFIKDYTYGYRIIFGVSNLASLFWYNFFSISMLHNHRKRVVNEFSSIDVSKDLFWVFFIVVFYSVYWLSLILISLMSIAFTQLHFLPFLVNYSVMLFLIYALGFYGLHQKVVYINDSRTLHDSRKVKYSGSTLSDQQKESIKALILNFFESQKPYLDSDFNMDALSNGIDVPKHTITEVINMELKCNFYTFVNVYRIEAVKKMLADPGNLFSIEAIAYECGFNSKSAFYKVFKEKEGCTPNLWKDRNITAKSG